MRGFDQVQKWRAVAALTSVMASLALLGSAALAYGPQVPPGAAPAPKVGAGAVQNSTAPEPVAKGSVGPSTPTSLQFSLPGSGPTSTTTIEVNVLPGTFVQSGTLELEVPSSQNLAALQQTIGKSETIVTAFLLSSKAKTKGPSRITVDSPLLKGKVSVFAVRPNGKTKGYHFVYVNSLPVKNGVLFVSNRNELYVLVVAS